MKNYINFRMQSYSNLKIKNCVKHNLRLIKSRSKLNDNTNIFIDKDFNNKKFNSKNVKGIKNIFKDLNDQYNSDRQQHNDLYKKYKKRSVIDTHSSWLEGVFTFSEAIHHDLGSKYSQNDLINCANNAIKKLCENMGADFKGAFLHMDETTPHFHFFLNNYDDKGNSIYYKNKKTAILSKFQDLVFKEFEVLGMERGIKKTSNTLDYTTIKKHNENLLNNNSKLIKMNDELINENIELNKLLLKMQEMDRFKYKKKYEDSQYDLQVARDEKSSLIKNGNYDKAHIARLNEEISTLKSAIKKSKNDYDELNKLNSKFNSELVSKNKKIKELESKINSSALDNFTQEELIKNNNKLSKSNDELNKKVDALEEELRQEKQLSQELIEFKHRHTMLNHNFN